MTKTCSCETRCRWIHFALLALTVANSIVIIVIAGWWFGWWQKLLGG